MSSKIKKVEELEKLEWESTTRLIKDIIIEIKDEYPGITCDIIPLDLHELGLPLLDKNNDIEVKFNVDKVTFKGDKNSVQRFQDLIRFQSIVLECISRIEEALDRPVKILGNVNMISGFNDIKFYILKKS